MKFFSATLVLADQEIQQIVESSLPRLLARILYLCWQHRNDLMAVSLSGGERVVEDPAVWDFPDPCPSCPTEQELCVPGWLAEPIEENFWFPHQKESTNASS